MVGLFLFTNLFQIQNESVLEVFSTQFRYILRRDSMVTNGLYQDNRLFRQFA
jgi:hypothetical protein